MKLEDQIKFIIKSHFFIDIKSTQIRKNKNEEKQNKKIIKNKKNQRIKSNL